MQVPSNPIIEATILYFYYKIYVDRCLHLNLIKELHITVPQTKLTPPPVDCSIKKSGGIKGSIKHTLWYPIT